MRLTNTYPVAASPADVERVLLSPDFAIEAERLRRDTVITTWVEARGESDHAVRFDICSDEHDRNRFGIIDRTRHVRGVTHCNWDRQGQTMRWRYVGVGGDFISVSGETRVVAEGNGARIHSVVDLRVNMPIVGRVIEAAVAKVFREGFASEQATLERHVAAIAPKRAA